jgi:U3 small nucleolar RNA-associated protein 4
MDIHRCRFVQYPPQPINALAFSHLSDPKLKTPSDLRLALGRNNGDIEIWNPSNGLWVQETILKGSKSTTIEQLAWTRDLLVDEDETVNGQKYSRGPLRLFSTGGSTAITEWDLCTGMPKRKAEGNFGDIWCFAPQPQIKANKVPDTLLPGAGSQLLAAGCSDGTIVLFSTEDDDLRYGRVLAQPPVKKPKVLSLAWRGRDTLVAGYEDSTIRIIDIPSRRIVRNMSLGKPAEGSSNSVVWSVKCLPDGTIVSGDSSGELKIWDSKNYSLVQRLSSHEADVLDIAFSASGDTIFSVGVDRRTVTYKQVPIHSGTQRTRWAEVAHKRYHQHDVKCAASFESKDLSILVSGGMDTRPVVVPIRHLQTEYHRALPHLPQRPQVSASRASRLFISWWDREIMIYHVPKYQHSPGDDSPEEVAGPHYEAVARLTLQGEESIQNAQISEDGQFIVAATINSVKLFQLRKTHVSGNPGLRTRQIDLPPTVARLGARQVGFSPDGKWLFTIRKDNAVALVKVTTPSDPKERPSIHEKVVKLYRQSRPLSSSLLGTYSQTITQTAFSSDSRMLAVGDLSGSIEVWILEGHEDLGFIDTTGSDHSSESSSGSSSSTTSTDQDDDSSSPVIHAQRWIRNPSGSSLPKLDSAILALTFRPSPIVPTHATHDNFGLHATRHNPHPVAQERPSPAAAKLFVVTATHQITEFDVLSSTLSDWSRRNPSQFLPRDFTRIKDRVIGCFWDCGDVRNKGSRLWLYGSSWVAMLDVSKNFPQDEREGHEKSHKKGNDASNRAPDGGAEKIGRLGRYDVLEPVINGAKLNGTATYSRGAPKSRTAAQRDHEQSRKRKRNTGAGDEIRPQERETGVGRFVRRFKNAAGENSEMIDLDEEDSQPAEGDEDEDDNMELDNALALMRRAEREREQQHQHQNGTTVPDPAEQATSAVTAIKTKTPRPWLHWNTFEYHSILGISVIGPGLPMVSPAAPSTLRSISTPVVDSADSAELKHEDGRGEAEADANPNTNIEVIIVERPIYDIDQVPRFDGGQEWDV